jgi:hypothetical protein
MLHRASAGRYSAVFTAAEIGVYTVLLRARGVTLEGQSFARERNQRQRWADLMVMPPIRMRRIGAAIATISAGILLQRR